MIGIIDYKMGNIGSIQNMLKRISVKSVISSKIEILNNCDKLILPGVGSFDQGMKNLKNHNFVRFLNDYVIKDKKPILGICLGMQLFADNSEEGDLSGLGWIKGNVKKFNLRKDGLKVPHMGWNNIECKNSKLFLNLPNEKRFYFVHSFFFLNVKTKKISFQLQIMELILLHRLISKISGVHNFILRKVISVE